MYYYYNQIILQTVLRYLLSHPSSYALWLDTTGTFSPEWGAQILEDLSLATSDSTSIKSTHFVPDSQPKETEQLLASNESSQQFQSGGLETTKQAEASLEESEEAEQSLPPLDRLIVSKVFDLPSAIQAIQRVRKDGFPISSSSTQNKQSTTDTKDDTKERDQQRRDHLNLAFIVVDSVTTLLKGLLSGVTAEGTFPSILFQFANDNDSIHSNHFNQFTSSRLTLLTLAAFAQDTPR